MKMPLLQYTSARVTAESTLSKSMLDIARPPGLRLDIATKDILSPLNQYTIFSRHRIVSTNIEIGAGAGAGGDELAGFFGII
jgi:hypothetical protein